MNREPRALLVLLSLSCALGSCSQDAAIALPPDAAAQADPLSIGFPASVPGIVGQPVTATLVAKGGTPPYRWTAAAMMPLPEGFTLSPEGVLHGTSTTIGTFPFAVTVSDEAGQSITAALELVVEPPRPPGDTCEDATSLLYVGEQAFIGGTLQGYHADGTASGCELPKAPDRFYRLEVEQTSQVTIEVGQGGVTAALYEAGCTQGPAVCATKIAKTLPKGRYVLGVTGTGPVDLTLTVHPVFPQGPGDTCEDAIPLDLSAGETRLSGTFQGAAQDLEGCGTGPDRVFSFTLTQAADVEALAVEAEIGFSIRSGTCTASTQLACTGGRLRMPNLPPGQYYLVLSGSLHSPAPFEATVKVLPPTLPPVNTTWETALPVTFVDDRATVEGDLLWAGPTTVSCPSRAPAVFHAIDLERKTNLVVTGPKTLSLKLLSSDGSWYAGTPCERQNSVFCVPAIEPGRYYLVVRWAAPGTPGPFQLQLQRRSAEVPANATCASPTLLTLDAGKATVVGQVFHGSYSLPGTLSGPGVFYQLRLEQPSTLKLTLAVPEREKFGVGVVAGSCTASTTLGSSGITGPSGSLSVGAEPGDHWIVVTGRNLLGDGCWVGAFTLTVEATPL